MKYCILSIRQKYIEYILNIFIDSKSQKNKINNQNAISNVEQQKFRQQRNKAAKNTN